MTDTELVARLERLERDNRRLKRVALGALVLVAASVGLGAAYAKPAIPQRIVAHEFDVVDGSGKVRAKVGLQCAGAGSCWPAIDLLDQDGKRQVTLAATETNSGLVFLGPKGKPRLSLAANDVESSVSLFSQFGRYAMLEVLGDSKQWGMDQLLFDDNDGSIAISTMFHPAIQIRDKGGINRVEMGIGGPAAFSKTLGGLEVGSGGYLGLWNGNDKLRFLADDSPRIELGDANGYEAAIGRMDLITSATGETHQTSAASILLFGNDKKHHVIWEAPQQ